MQPNKAMTQLQYTAQAVHGDGFVAQWSQMDTEAGFGGGGDAAFTNLDDLLRHISDMANREWGESELFIEISSKRAKIELSD